jgi:hypothetical protein
MEQDMSLRASILTAPPEIARLEEGDDDGDAGRWPRGSDFAMTYEEIGQALGGISRTRVKGIIDKAIGKLRNHSQCGPRRRTWDEVDRLMRGAP